MPDVVVRPAVLADAGPCAALHVRCWQQAYTSFAPGVSDLDPAGRVERWEREVPRGLTLVAVAGDAVVGFTAVEPPDELALLYVDAAWHGRRVGAALHDAALALLPPGPARLWVLEANTPARGFYAARGWRPTGERQEVDVAGTLLPEVRLRRAG